MLCHEERAAGIFRYSKLTRLSSVPALRAPSARAATVALAGAATVALGRAATVALGRATTVPLAKACSISFTGANAAALSGVHATALATRFTPLATRSTETEPESRGFSAADEHDARSGNDRQCDDEDSPHILYTVSNPDFGRSNEIRSCCLSIQLVIIRIK